MPPFAFKDDKGELVGFDIDVARLAANALFRDPNKLEFVVSDQRRPLARNRERPGGYGYRRHHGFIRTGQSARRLHPSRHRLRHF